MRYYIYLILIVLLLITNGASSQDIEKVVTIETIDGNSFTGKVVSQTNEIIMINTKSAGTISINKDAIKSIDKIYLEISNDNEIESKYRSFPSRYFIGTSGYNLKKGEVYYSNTWLLFNDISYGVTDYFSIGAGIVPLFILGEDEFPVWIKTKLSYPIIENKFNISGGAILITVMGASQDNFELAGALYGVSTFGSKDRNITFGLYYRFSEEPNGMPMFTISGKYKITSQTYLIADTFQSNLFNLGVVGAFTLGARTMLKRISLDYGVIIPHGNDFWEKLIFPYFGMKFGFGNN